MLWDADWHGLIIARWSMICKLSTVRWRTFWALLYTLPLVCTAYFFHVKTDMIHYGQGISRYLFPAWLVGEMLSWTAKQLLSTLSLEARRRQPVLNMFLIHRVPVGQWALLLLVLTPRDVFCPFEPWINSTGADQVKHHSGSYSAVVPGTNLRYTPSLISTDVFAHNRNSIISINDIYWYKNKCVIPFNSNLTVFQLRSASGYTTAIVFSMLPDTCSVVLRC
jgi:hypothetical protein